VDPRRDRNDFGTPPAPALGFTARSSGLCVSRLLAPRIQKRLAGRTARLIALVALATLTIGILILLILGTVAFFKSDTGNLQTLFEQMQRIITDACAKLPL
jgi:choline-glycine betaine transporter